MMDKDDAKYFYDLACKERDEWMGKAVAALARAEAVEARVAELQAELDKAKARILELDAEEIEGMEAMLAHTTLLEEQIAALRARVAELEAEQAWRPVTEPPTEPGSYLLAYSDRNAYVLGWWHGINSHHGWGRYGVRATYWHELPAPAPQ